MTMELDGKQRQMLRVGLGAAFQEYDKFRRFLIDNCNFDLNAVTDAGSGMDAARDDVIQAALSDGWIGLLLDQCAAHANPNLKSVATLLQQQLAKSRPIFYNKLVEDPFSALFLGPAECFIGRAELRTALKEMASDNGVRRVLVVNGTNKVPACGKTYTYELLRLLDRLGNGNIVVKINFREFREGDLGSRYRDIVEKINSRMRVPAEQIPKLNESQTRWFQNVIDKFEIVAREAGNKLWLVFDHIGSDVVEDKIADALANTAIYTVTEASALRVILIDVDPAALKLETPILKKLRKDNAALPGRADLVTFLKQARDWSGKNHVLDPEIDSAATEIMASLAGLSEADRAYEFSTLTWNCAARLGFVQ
jgi:hypothetical protein